MDIREIASRLRKIKRSGNGYLACCPAHDDKTPSLSLKQSENGSILLHCFAGCSLSAVLSALQLTESDLFPSAEVTTFPYKKKPTALYPYFDLQGKVLFEVCRYEPKDFRIRRLKDGKYSWGLGDTTPVLYGLPDIAIAISSGETIYFCEGEKDCHRLRKLGLCATTVPMGAGKWNTNYTESLRKAAKVIILPDNDEPGRRHASLIAFNLTAAGIECTVKALWLADPLLPLHGDVSDFLDRNPLSSLQNAPNILLGPLTTTEEEEKPPLPFTPTLREYLRSNFMEDCKTTAGYPSIQTGFPSLDNFLGNRLLPGLYILGAISSLGKTAFCGQLCDTLAAQGQRVLFFTLEMSMLEMVSRSLVRTLFSIDAVKYQTVTTAHFLRGEIPFSTVECGMKQLEAMGENITYIEGNFNLGVGEIREQLEVLSCRNEFMPVVFVDYLQVLNPLETRMSDKQATDRNIVELKRISRDFGLAIVVISSLNRQNYNDELSFTAFKESGAIEYSADFVMGLQARGVSEAVAQTGGDERKLLRQIAKTVKQAKNTIPRPLEAVVLKNRRGEAQGSFPLRYWPGQNYFEEG